MSHVACYSRWPIHQTWRRRKRSSQGNQGTFTNFVISAGLCKAPYALAGLLGLGQDSLMQAEAIPPEQLQIMQAIRSLHFSLFVSLNNGNSARAGSQWQAEKTQPSTSPNFIL